MIKLKKGVRERIIDGLRHLIFRLDTTKYLFDKPKFNYQPIPWVGIDEAGVRGEASKSRWNEIRRHLDNNYSSLKDIGCCVGFFSMSACMEFGMDTIGIDNNSRYLRIAEYAIPQKLVNKCSFINLKIDEYNSSILPTTDITLCLSIWHHWFFYYGIEGASEILKNIWKKTNKIMFFESGEEETKEEFNLPFDVSQTAKDWLSVYLQKVCDNSRIEIIGEFYAGDYPHYKIKNHKRSLFKVVRDG